jgi:hypothetical protein
MLLILYRNHHKRDLDFDNVANTKLLGIYLYVSIK